MKPGDSKESSGPPRDTRWLRRLPAPLTLAGGLVLSLAGFWLARAWEIGRLTQDFRAIAEGRAQAMSETIRTYEECLFALRDVFHATVSVSPGEFRRAARAQIERHPGLVRLEWLPRVKREERAAFEANVRVRGWWGDWMIRDGETETQPSGPREEFLPLLYSEPTEGRPATLGVDQFLGENQRAIARALETKQPSASRRFPLSQKAEAPAGVAIYLPVFGSARDRQTSEGAREELRGFLRCVFRLDRLAMSDLAQEMAPLDGLLLDETPASTEPYLFHMVDGRVGFAPPPVREDFAQGLRHSARIACGGRNWLLLVRPTVSWLQSRRSFSPLAVLGAGLCATGLLASRQNQARKRAEEVERLVATRTEELRRVQEELREDVRQRLAAEERYRAFVAQSTEAIWNFEIVPPLPLDQPEEQQIDHVLAHAVMAECNDECARMYGRERAAEMIGVRLCEVMPRENPANVEHLREYVRSRFRLVDSESRELDRAGNERVFLNNITGIIEGGKLVRAWGTQRDVTGRRQAEEERAKMEQRLQDAQKLESLGVLAGGIAHDFNNLLTGILGHASLARMDLAPSSPAQQNLQQIEHAAQRAAELCKQMLAYSGKGRFVVQAVDLSQLVEEAAPLLQVSVSKGAVLKYRLTRELPAVNADVTQLRQILMNLVINASDAFEGRDGVIEITTGVMRADAEYLATTHLAPELPEGSYVFLEVSDNGCGMEAETQKRIFDPFFTTKFTGRGLGLAAVLGIVRGHQGALRVYSEPGRGTTFKLLLPAISAPAEALPGASQAVNDWRGSGRVLVVDDELAVREVAARMLKAFGFEPQAVMSGREAIEAFRGGGAVFAAVLLDLTMPQMDGTEAFTELRRLKPDVKVLLMSGFNEQDAINRFAGKGLAGFLQKPFKPEALREKLRAMLG